MIEATDPGRFIDSPAALTSGSSKSPPRCAPTLSHGYLQRLEHAFLG
jgi:hypothetical protein